MNRPVPLWRRGPVFVSAARSRQSPHDMFRRFLAFRTRHQPYMVRHSYRHELRSALTFPLAASLAEGSFTGVIAAKNFGAGVVLMSLITAAPMFGNITALIWSDLAMGRRKVPLVNMLQLGVVLMIASVALTALVPPAAAGWVFAGQIIVARLLASGIITIRSSIWRANYPRQLRGQLTSRIATVATFVLTVTTFAGSYLLDQNPRAYVYLYPSAALLGAVGIWQFGKIRVRREVLLRRQEVQLYAPDPDSMSQTDEANVLNYESHPRFVKLFAQAFQILRDDPQFRAYQRWQFLNGAAFMAMTPPLVFMVSREMTDDRTQYLLATVVLQLVPMVTSIVFTQIWSPLFDRVHISVFRVWQGFVSVTAHGLLFAGAMLGLLWLVAIGQFVVGISNAAGSLAWNLGHNDFAPPEKSANYMAVHVMLTGLRGFIAPFVGVLLYAQLGLRHYVFALTAAMSLASLLGFAWMARKAPKKMPPEPVKRMTEATA